MVVYGLLRILHVAHAGLFTLGGYVGVLTGNAGGNLGLALVFAMLVVGVIGMGFFFCVSSIDLCCRDRLGMGAPAG